MNREDCISNEDPRRPISAFQREGADPATPKMYGPGADLYDIAFDWDVSDEVAWLAERIDGRSVLEPACGSGRMLAAFADRGFEVAGLDTSEPMLEIARRRLGGRGLLVTADMTDFDLGRGFDGAVCPINTLLHLTPSQFGRHLVCVARHVPRYLAQVALYDPAVPDPFPGSHGRPSVATRG
jgi:SAM-dependent methyltransferase